MTVGRGKGWADASSLGEHRADLSIIHKLSRAYPIRFRGAFLDKD